MPSLRIVLSEEQRARESVFGVDLIDRRPFELPLDRRYYTDLRVTPELRVGFTGLICTPHRRQCRPFVFNIAGL